MKRWIEVLSRRFGEEVLIPFLHQVVYNYSLRLHMRSTYRSILCASSVNSLVSVVSIRQQRSTTEAREFTEVAQRVIVGWARLSLPASANPLWPYYQARLSARIAPLHGIGTD